MGKMMKDENIPSF